MLFDPSYPTRLWTMFELAAFLKAHEDVADGLIIRPTFLGPAAVGLFVFDTLLAICIILASYEEIELNILVLALVFYFIFASGGHWLRGYFRQIDECLDKLKSFSLKEATSQCCTMNHRDNEARQALGILFLLPL